MNRLLSKTGLAAGLLLAGAVCASASTVQINVLDASGDGSGAAANTSNNYAANYGAFIPSGATWTPGDANVVTPPPGTTDGTYRSPFDGNALEDVNSFFAVGPSPNDPNPVKLVFSGAQSVLNILWGSIDSYNTLSFSAIGGGGSDVSITGADVASAVNAAFSGTCGSPANFGCTALVSFSILDDTGASTTFGTVAFKSTDQQAFEFALAPIPLPAGGLLLLSALGGIVALRRKKRTG
ncbi:VPLPA-CTERM sorting domain-containing protein [Roseovarius sp.]|uniref:Npun_F0296 family exosortase-dependent surface protein n=1 Tax=Roseovarius sp. TaxID=1486281 RepID=UPI003D1353A2